MKQTKNLRQQLSINLSYCYSSRTAMSNQMAYRAKFYVTILTRPHTEGHISEGRTLNGLL